MLATSLLPRDPRGAGGQDPGQGGLPHPAHLPQVAEPGHAAAAAPVGQKHQHSGAAAFEFVLPVPVPVRPGPVQGSRAVEGLGLPLPRPEHLPDRHGRGRPYRGPHHLRLPRVVLRDGVLVQVAQTGSGPHSWWTRNLLRRVERLCLRHATRIITVCDSLAERIQVEFHAERRWSWCNIPYLQGVAGPADCKDLRQELALGKDDFVLLYQGGVGPWRGLEPVIEALAQVPQVALVIRGPSIGQYREESAWPGVCGVGQRVFCLDPVPSTQVVAAAATPTPAFTLSRTCASTSAGAAQQGVRVPGGGAALAGGRLPGVRKIVNGYQVGLPVRARQPGGLHRPGPGPHGRGRDAFRERCRQNMPRALQDLTGRPGMDQAGGRSINRCAQRQDELHESPARSSKRGQPAVGAVAAQKRSPGGRQRPRRQLRHVARLPSDRCLGGYGQQDVAATGPAGALRPDGALRYDVLHLLLRAALPVVPRGPRAAVASAEFYADLKLATTARPQDLHDAAGLRRAQSDLSAAHHTHTPCHLGQCPTAATAGLGHARRRRRTVETAAPPTDVRPQPELASASPARRSCLTPTWTSRRSRRVWPRSDGCRLDPARADGRARQGDGVSSSTAMEEPETRRDAGARHADQELPHARGA